MGAVSGSLQSNRSPIVLVSVTSAVGSPIRSRVNLLRLVSLSHLRKGFPVLFCFQFVIRLIFSNSTFPRLSSVLLTKMEVNGTKGTSQR